MSIKNLVLLTLTICLLAALSMPASAAVLNPSFTYTVDGLRVDFKDTTPGRVKQRWWGFGDGASSMSRNLFHIYDEPGEYTVVLWVWDAKNNAWSSSKKITLVGDVPVPPPPDDPPPPPDDPPPPPNDPPTSVDRDYYKQPFSSTSPWNHPIGTGAVYTSVPNLSSKGVGIRWGDNWTTGIYQGKTTDRQGTLYFRNDMWMLLDSGITINGTHYPVKNSGNPAVVENALIAGAHDLPYKSGSSGAIWPANMYSTYVPKSSSPCWPSGIHVTTDNHWSPIFYSPVGAVPSPDTDGNIAIFQPNGWILECYSAVMLSNGSIVCWIASYIDSAGSGDGYSSGRRASLLPTCAGQIRQGEITSGSINHALVCSISPTILKEQAQWPAVCWDMNSGYSGTLPMGALLAIPQSVNINSLGLTAKGLIMARAVQNYGLYVTDRGGDGINILADLKATDVRWTSQDKDLQIIRNNLKWVSNNSEATPGGGGTPLVPLLP